MYRDYDTGKITPVEFYGNPITRERTLDILERLQISIYDSMGCFRSTADLIKDLQRVSNGTSSFAATRMAIDAMDALIESHLANFEFNLKDTEESDDLDMFLGTFKIVQGV